MLSVIGTRCPLVGFGLQFKELNRGAVIVGFKMHADGPSTLNPPCALHCALCTKGPRTSIQKRVLFGI